MESFDVVVTQHEQQRGVDASKADNHEAGESGKEHSETFDFGISRGFVLFGTLKRKNLRNTNSPGRPRMATALDDRRTLLLVKKNPL